MTPSAPTPAAPPARPPAPTFLRPLLAFLGGLGITVVAVVIGTFVATLALLRGGNDVQSFMVSPAYLTAKLVVTLLGGAIGGFTTSRVTAGRSFYTVFLVALVLFMSAMVPAVRGAAALIGQPSWYPIALALVAPAGVLIGGLLERRRHLADAPA